jgi:hypothetical protein
MKKFLLLIISIACLPMLMLAQEATLTMVEFPKVGAVDAVTITVEGQLKNIEYVVDQKFQDETGGKTKSYKGFRTGQSVVYREIASKTIDYYFTVEKEGTKEAPRGRVILMMSLGNNTFMDADRYPDEMAAAEKVLEELPRDVRVYELQLAIEEQEKIIEKTVKDYEKLGTDSLSLEAQLIETQLNIEANRISRQQQKVRITEEETKLTEFKEMLKSTRSAVLEKKEEKIVDP